MAKAKKQDVNEAIELLGLREGDSAKTVRAAVRSLSQKYHPDKEGGDADMFQKVREAGEFLLELLQSHEGIPSPHFIESVYYVASNLAQLYVTAEMNGNNAKRRKVIAIRSNNPNSFKELLEVYQAAGSPASVEAWALNSLEEQLIGEIASFRANIETMITQGEALRELSNKVKGPALAHSYWQDTRDGLAKGIRDQRHNIRMVDRRLKALTYFEAIQEKKTEEVFRIAATKFTNNIRYR